MSSSNAPYQVINVPLAAAADRVLVVDRNVPIWSISVRKISGGLADVTVVLGKNGNPIPVRQGNEIEFRHVPSTAGLYVSSAGGVGGSIDFCITYQANEGDQRGPAFAVSET